MWPCRALVSLAAFLIAVVPAWGSIKEVGGECTCKVKTSLADLYQTHLSAYGLANTRLDVHSIRLAQLNSRLMKAKRQIETLRKKSDIHSKAHLLEQDIKKLEDDVCTVSDAQREDCGWSGMDPMMCDSEHCCWDPSTKKGVPSCFRQKSSLGCGPRQFQCGNGTVECISDVLLCDGSKDCHNGADEEEAACSHHWPIGSKWSGEVHWTACWTIQNETMNITIVGTRARNYFTARTTVIGLLEADYVEDGQTQRFEEPLIGYIKGGPTRQLVLLPPKGSTDKLALYCDQRYDHSTADCRILQEGTLATCATSTITRVDVKN